MSEPLASPVPPPGPRRDHRDIVIAVLATVLVIAAVGGTVWALRSRQNGPVHAAATSAPATLSTASTATTSTSTTSTTTTTPTTIATTAPTLPATLPPTYVPATADPNVAAHEQLIATRAAYQSTVAQLDGWWVPQISAKKIGLVADGRVYNDRLILQNFLDWQSRFPDAVLLYSADYPTFESSNFWITLVNVSYSTPAGANGWCDANGLSSNDCFAKLVSTTYGPAGSSVMR